MAEHAQGLRSVKYRSVRISEEDAEIFAGALARRRLAFPLGATEFRAIERVLAAWGDAAETEEERIYTVSERRERENDP